MISLKEMWLKTMEKLNLNLNKINVNLERINKKLNYQNLVLTYSAIQLGKIKKLKTKIRLNNKLNPFELLQRGRDSNPRFRDNGIHTFQACAFDHSATSLFILKSMLINKKNKSV